jgi:salicylate hydroxylase
VRAGNPGGTIAIAGAGIAGLSAAIALKLAGFPVAVFEREAKLEPIGAGIQLGPNATRILEHWNLALLENSIEPDGIELRNARTGALLNTIPLRRAARARYGAPYVTILRADLQAALLSRANELGVPIEFASPVTRIDSQAKSLTLEAGGGTHDVAALVGADGLNSSVRKRMRSCARPFSTHAVAWRAILPLAALPAPLRSIVMIWMGPGAHLVHYPVSGGACINAVLVIDGGFWNESGPDGTSLAFLLRRLRGWAELPRSVVSSTEAWQPWTIQGVEKSNGGNGRVQLIGDAWHAMPPFLASGGVMAIEDGGALAECLTEADGAIEPGFELFRERRSARVWRVAARSTLAGRFYHCPQPFDVIRDLTIKSATGTMLLAKNDWLYGPSARKS